MTDTNFGETLRIKALQRALGLPLPDAVYELVRYNDWLGRSGNGIDLSELRSKGSPADLDEWVYKSRKLRREAYAVGSAGLARDGTYAFVRQQFEAENPGFGSTSYDDAVSFGYQEAR